MAGGPLDEAYRLTAAVPTVEEYRRLRRVSGLTPRSAEAAAAGLPNTIAAVVVRNGDDAVGMGRAIGDGLFYQIVDIAVAPEHQGRGLGKAIVAALMDRLRAIAPAEAYVSLIADGEAHRLYAQYGFAPTAPASIGMATWVGRDDPA
ncbi:MAG: GNAT family N-acetyltransferase [Janthinobacterium lividum]